MSLTPGTLASAEDLVAFAVGARTDGRSLVVGALIHDSAGRIYLQRRTLTRALFPGSWDLVGGHAEDGEDVRTALHREVREETGWLLTDLGPVVEVIDWEEGGVARREVDLLASVAGDLAHPALERDKHSEGRWVTRSEAQTLADERAAEVGAAGPDAWVFAVVQRAFDLLGG